MKCLECNKEVKSIGYKHLKSCSGISTKEYKIRYPHAKLVDDDVVLKCIHTGQDNGNYNHKKHQEGKWIRTCECGNDVIHNSYESYERTLKEKRKCNSCKYKNGAPWDGKKHEEKTKQKISDVNKGKDYNKSRLGIKETEETKKKKSLALKGRSPAFKGKKHSLETKLKMRLKRIEDLDKKFPNGWTSPNYNKKACVLFEKINSELNWNGQHAERVREFRILGYFLDYYEPTLNVVIEYDEKNHEKPKQKQRDLEKQILVTQELNCKFYRIKEGEEENWKKIIFTDNDADSFL